MKAACLHETGRPDSIRIEDVDSPTPGDQQVLINVEAACVNPIDTYVRGGVIAFDLPDPYFPGCDAAGTVAAVGPSVKQFRVGARVWCTNQGLLGRQGTFAQQIAVDAQWCYETPDNVSSEDAAANALVGVTAHLGLFREADLQPAKPSWSSAAPAESDRWSSRWPKPPARKSSRPPVRKTRKLWRKRW